MCEMGTEAVEMSRLKNGEAQNSRHKQTDQVPAEGFTALSDEYDGNLGKVSDSLEDNIHSDAVSVSWTHSCIYEIFASICCVASEIYYGFTYDIII